MAVVTDGSFGAALVGFLVMHAQLLAANCTTIEMYEKDRMHPWPYNKCVIGRPTYACYEINLITLYILRPLLHLSGAAEELGGKIIDKLIAVCSAELPHALTKGKATLAAKALCMQSTRNSEGCEGIVADEQCPTPDLRDKSSPGLEAFWESRAMLRGLRLWRNHEDTNTSRRMNGGAFSWLGGLLCTLHWVDIPLAGIELTEMPESGVKWIGCNWHWVLPNPPATPYLEGV
eukprot:1147173-Pelagomonas_calceolata.AAC.2